MKLTREQVHKAIASYQQYAVYDGISGITQTVSAQDIFDYLNELETKILKLALAVADKIPL